jgi:hypothetical protein
MTSPRRADSRPAVHLAPRLARLLQDSLSRRRAEAVMTESDDLVRVIGLYRRLLLEVQEVAARTRARLEYLRKHFPEEGQSPAQDDPDSQHEAVGVDDGARAGRPLRR